jgi:hypothetical protein
MKRYFTYFLLTAASAFLSTACNEDQIEYNKAETPLALSVNETDLTLDVRNPDNEAIVFSWTNGTNGGSNAAIDYLLQIDRQGNNFDGGLTIELGRRVYTYKYTAARLNDVLLGDFNVAPGESITLEARILALVASERASDQISETVMFTATAYMPVSTTLYMIGSSTSGGWSLDDATVMNAISKEAGGFTVTTNLTSGDFKFVPTREDFTPSYNRDANASEPKLIYRQGASDPDEKFIIAAAGRYRITVNIIDLTITIEELEPSVLPRYNKMYFVGDFTGWSFIEMTTDPFNPFIFRYGAVLNGGGDRDFKFSTYADFDNSVVMFHPTVADAPMTHTAATFYAGNPDYKWKLTSTQNNKPYKMAVNITEGQETMTMAEYAPYTTLYVIGDASPIGWSLDNRNNAKMTKADNDFTYTWTGQLGTGEIKFKCSDDNSWDNNATHPWYLAPDFDVPVTPNTEMILTSNLQGTPGSDRKWIVQEAGIYTITINQLAETIRFAK